MRRSRFVLSVVALSLPVLALSACGSSSGDATSSMPAPTTSASSSSASSSTPTSDPSASAVYPEAFCAAFAPLLDLPDPTGPTDPTVDEALATLEAARAVGDELGVAQVDAIIAVYLGMKEGTITIPVQQDDPIIADGALAIQQIILGCNLMPTG